MINMGKIGALLITLAAGLSFFLGALVPALFKNKNKISEFSIAMAFSVMLGVIILDLIPEALELFGNIKKAYRILAIAGFGILGISLLKILDIFVPDHDHNKVPKNKHEKHLYHIGLVTAIALLFHNIVEGISIYSSYLVDQKMGILLSLGVMLHNIPFGIQVSSNMSKDKIKSILILVLLSCSTLIGALCIFIFNASISSFVLGILISLTLGMMIYISVVELLGEVVVNLKNKTTIIGLISGFLVLALSTIL